MKLNNSRFSYRLLLAVISGVLVIPISYLETLKPPKVLNISMIDYSIATIFALLVMIPFQKKPHWLRIIAMIISSVVIYTSVVKLALNRYELLFLNLDYTVGITLSGALGALLTGVAIQILAPISLNLKSYLLLALIGLIGGYIFSICIDSSLIVINSLGFVLWQTGVFVVLFFSNPTYRHTKVSGVIVQ